MAKLVINPAAELPPRPGDLNLSLDGLGALGVFATVKKAPAFAKFPGSQVLRRYRPGQVICQQGQPGSTAFYMLTRNDLERLREFVESREQRQDIERMLAVRDVPEGEDMPQRLATARLAVGRQARAGGRSWLARLMLPTRDEHRQVKPRYIPNDGPTDIRYDTREAPIFAGEVFGEMSCLTRQPRSATVLADSDCYALEILRNILEQLRRDPTYKKQSEEKYRQRVLEGHLRQLSVFKLLTPEQFRKVQDRVELVDVEPGQVIWDEGDPSDSVYVVRSGIVQVLQSFPWRVTADQFRDLSAVVTALTEARHERPAREKLWDALSTDLQAALETGAANGIAERLATELNDISKAGKVLTAKQVATELSHPRLARDTTNYPAKVRDWNGLQLRRASRLLYDVLFGEAITPAAPRGVTRVLTYSGRGDTLGEIGLALGEPRSATCVAYSHPDGDRESTNVELVKIDRELFGEMVTESSAAREEIKRMVKSRQARDAERTDVALSELADTKTAENLGLLQGQKLMLIDLDRCTRCGDCVQACIQTHQDGHTRLYLDGPRYGKYLIPSSCRQCRDPVCMIGCPVGSIQQGTGGQIEITDWCIGCGVCARQCPYDSIQMHDTALIPAGSPGWLWSGNVAGASDQKWTGIGFSDARWQVADAPFVWSFDIAGALNGNAEQRKDRIQFRLKFAVRELVMTDYQLTLTTAGSAPAAWLNGAAIELAQDARQKKKGEFQATLGADALRRGSNLLAVSVTPPTALGELLLDARLDTLTDVDEQVEEKLVTEQAVVCDQCASLAGDRHACVYACPHEAAMRIDTWVEMPS